MRRPLRASKPHHLGRAVAPRRRAVAPGVLSHRTRTRIKVCRLHGLACKRPLDGRLEHIKDELLGMDLARFSPMPHRRQSFARACCHVARRRSPTVTVKQLQSRSQLPFGDVPVGERSDLQKRNLDNNSGVIEFGNSEKDHFLWYNHEHYSVFENLRANPSCFFSSQNAIFTSSPSSCRERFS